MFLDIQRLDAAIVGQLRLVKMLVERGADPCFKNRKGKTPCDVAAAAVHNFLITARGERNLNLYLFFSLISFSCFACQNVIWSQNEMYGVCLEFIHIALHYLFIYFCLQSLDKILRIYDGKYFNFSFITNLRYYVLQNIFPRHNVFGNSYELTFNFMQNKKNNKK